MGKTILHGPEQLYTVQVFTDKEGNEVNAFNLLSPFCQLGFQKAVWMALRMEGVWVLNVPREGQYYVVYDVNPYGDQPGARRDELAQRIFDILVALEKIDTAEKNRHYQKDLGFRDASPAAPDLVYAEEKAWAESQQKIQG